jgi:hypothetical protein
MGIPPLMSKVKARPGFTKAKPQGLLFAIVEYRQERFLRNLDIAHLLHTLLTFFLFLKQLSLTRDVTTIALGGNVLAKG